MVSLGVSLDGPYAALGELATRAEGRGFDRIWVSETSRDSIVQASVALQTTRTIGVGTSITVAFPRSPTVTATQAWDLAEFSSGRFTLGLGSQVRRIIEERYGVEFSQPAARMAEYIQAMRAVWALERGESARFEGDFYRVTRPSLAGPTRSEADGEPPILLAAVGPMMTRVAATHADGLLPHPMTSLAYLTQVVEPRVAEGLERAGRKREDFSIVQGLIVSIADDRATAVHEVKRQIGFYGATPNYRAIFASGGDDALTDDLRRAFRRGRRDADVLAEAVPDDVAERYAVAGTPDEVADRLTSFAEHADHLVLGGVWYQVPHERRRENLEAILETFGDGT